MRLEHFRDEEEGLLRGSLGENNGNTDAFRCSLMVNCGVVLGGFGGEWSETQLHLIQTTL